MLVRTSIFQKQTKSPSAFLLWRKERKIGFVQKPQKQKNLKIKNSTKLFGLKLIAVLLPVGGNRTHVTVPKDILTTITLSYSAIEVLIEFDKYFDSRVVSKYLSNSMSTSTGAVPWRHTLGSWLWRAGHAGVGGRHAPRRRDTRLIVDEGLLNWTEY